MMSIDQMVTRLNQSLVRVIQLKTCPGFLSLRGQLGFVCYLDGLFYYTVNFAFDYIEIEKASTDAELDSLMRDRVIAAIQMHIQYAEKIVRVLENGESETQAEDTGSVHKDGLD